MDAQSILGTVEKFLRESLRNPSIWIPIIVAFYVGVLGLCLTGALQRQATQIKRVREEKKSLFSMLDEDEDEDEDGKDS